MTGDRTGGILVVIPTLNEAEHIGGLLDGLMPFLERSGASLVVADGGSTDATSALVAERTARCPAITLLQNPQRIQSAAVNRAVAERGDAAEWLIRLDAHAGYPADFADILLQEARATGADSVVVGMDAVGEGVWQRAIAAAQNSRFGNGGAAHRVAPKGRFVDHGHHALMRVSAFRAVGGYDTDFGHNEDAELDHRLRAAGHRIWLTGRTRMTYYPRRSLGALMRQYFNFGRGRARNILKHRSRPGGRQLVVAALAPLMLLAVLAPLHPAFAVPLLLWIAGCAVAGAAIAWGLGDPRGLISGLAAGTMHAAWSTGFWREMIGRLRRGGTA